MKRLLYIYGEEFTGTRAREVHTINRVHSLAVAGSSVTLLAAVNEKFSSESLLQRFSLDPRPNLRIHFLPRQLKLGRWRMVSTAFFYRNVRSWLVEQKTRGNDFQLAYLIHLKAAKFLASKYPNLPYLFEAHEIFAESYAAGSSKYRKLTALEQSVYAKAAAVVATSHYLLGELRKQYRLQQPSVVIPNSVAEHFFALRPGGDARRIIYIGSFQHWKGVDIAVETMKLLPEFQLDIVGGSAEQINACKGSAGSNVTFHGFLKQEQFTPLLEKAAIALIPNRLTPRSSLYSFPMKLLEYGAAGKLVVASNLPVLRELNPGPWCRLVKAEDVEALAASIREVGAMLPLQQQAREWTRNYTWAKQAKELKDFILKV
ncbi:MAG: glycosyltransferase family 4 protein [Verrucomicrobiales bacterium]